MRTCQSARPLRHFLLVLKVLDAVRAQLEAANGTIKVATFSQIISLPAAILPVADLVTLCHEYGVLVLIDGAHALGQIPLNLEALGADFWVGNGHKWLFSPKGSAVLWVRQDRQSLVEPTVISWEGQGQPNTHFQMAFAYTGTASNSPYLAMQAALDFREFAGGEDRILSYIHGLAVNASRQMVCRLVLWK
jgi:selenocysteine lyase/cysteine desulfurase